MGRYCRLCGYWDPRGWTGASFCYPERDSMLCEACFKKHHKDDSNVEGGQ